MGVSTWDPTKVHILFQIYQYEQQSAWLQTESRSVIIDRFLYVTIIKIIIVIEDHAKLVGIDPGGKCMPILSQWLSYCN